MAPPQTPGYPGWTVQAVGLRSVLTWMQGNVRYRRIALKNSDNHFCR
jgi:hypothetical protein